MSRDSRSVHPDGTPVTECDARIDSTTISRFPDEAPPGTVASIVYVPATPLVDESTIVGDGITVARSCQSEQADPVAASDRHPSEQVGVIRSSEGVACRC